MAEALSFALLCVAATVTKLANSIDDVVWLMPFISGSRMTKIRHSTVYIGVLLTLTLLCGVLSQGFELLLEAILPEDSEDEGWGIQKIMAVSSGALLLLLASKFLYDWIQERLHPESDEEVENDSNIENNIVVDGNDGDCREVKLEVATDSEKAVDCDCTEVKLQIDDPEKAPAASQIPEKGSPEEDSPEEERTGDNKDDGKVTLRKLVGIIIVGSLDDVCVQASMLISGTFLLWHMLIGVFCGCCIVLSICWGASMMQRLVQVMEKVPLWSIIGALGVWTLIEAFV